MGPGNAAFDQLVLGSASAEAQDRELAEAVGRAVDMGIPVLLAAQTVSGNGVQGLSRPYTELLESAGGYVGLVGVRTDDDGVLRRYIPYGLDEEGEIVYGLALEAVASYLGVTLPSATLPDGGVPIGDDTVYKLSEDLKQTAIREAEATVGQAEIRGEKILDAAHRRAAKLQEDIREMKSLRGRIASVVRSTIETHLMLLDGLSQDPPDEATGADPDDVTQSLEPQAPARRTRASGRRG